MNRLCLAIGAAVVMTGCAAPGSKDPFVGFGPNPPLPAPRTSLIPMIGVPDVVHWPPGAGVREFGGGKLYLAYLRDPDGNKLCAMHRM